MVVQVMRKLPEFPLGPRDDVPFCVKSLKIVVF